MSKEDSFFQFPVAALHHDKAVSDVTRKEMVNRISEIISYCIVDIGKGIVAEKPADDVFEIALRYSKPKNLPCKTDKDRIVFCGAEQLNVTVSEAGWNYRSEVYEKIKGKPFGRCLVRLRSDLLWDALNNEGWGDWRDFAVLCGIYAGIGAYKRQKLTRDRIGALSLGFNGQRERDAFNATALQMTDRQTRRTIENLRQRGLFVVASPNGRHNFYSNRLTIENLIGDLGQADSKKLSPSQITAIIKRDIEAKKQAAIEAETKRLEVERAAKEERDRQQAKVDLSSLRRSQSELELDTEKQRQKFLQTMENLK